MNADSMSKPIPSNFPSPAKRVGALVMRHRGAAVRLLVLAMTGTLLSLVFPAVVQWFVDDIIPQAQRDRVWQAGGLAILAFLLKELLSAGRILCASALEQRITVDLRAEFHERLLRLPVPWFDRQRTGDLMTRMADDIPAIRRAVVEGLEQGVTALLLMVSAAALMFWTNPALASVVMVPIPLIAAGGWMYARWIAPKAATARRETGALNAAFQENVSGVRQIKASQAESTRHRQFQTQSEGVRRSQTRLAKVWAVYSPSMTFVGSLGLAILLTVGSLWCIDEKLTPGELMKFILLVGFLYEPIGRLHGVNQSMQEGRAAADRVFGVMAETPESPSDSPVTPMEIRNGIHFDQVRFTYPEAARPALDNVTLDIHRGQLTAIVGASGAGKSTLFRLLARFHEPAAGVIRLDDQPLNSWDLSTVRRSLAYVAQDPFLFSGTARDNLLLARPDATDDACWEALEEAGAADFVQAWPEKLNTEIGERGVRLSGGEKQRMALARVFLQDAPVLLLDEATSSLDTLSEQRIQIALEKLRKDRTCLVIAHRLSTVVKADVIHVMREGRILASGTHAELLNTCPYYAGLAELAFAKA